MKKVILLIVACLLAGNLWGQGLRLEHVTSNLVDRNIIYDPSYKVISYPMGDIDPKRGVCTDAVIRAYRKIGVDLQQLVHEDMKTNFSKYPQKWGRTEPDSNIDHRRVLNLMTFFNRKGTVLPITNNGMDYRPGNIICWELSSGIYHIGIVTNISNDGKKFLIFHQIGNGQVEEDVLFNWKIIGHYRYPAK